MADFRKAFFPTKEEIQQQKALLNRLNEEHLQRYLDQGFSAEEAEKLIEKDIKDFTERGYYS